ncbi:ligand-dependent nuclear receptor-interacting factor 1 [Eublepharis macularius]|uniref:Ligand-dependent nuclear receptor-interacting factor 1 n=1 Tax=Eublepharis macularius TaxID=481883 RepID=A0AA97JGU1_EUBMA|nr:ligand-dependent nuclear receptor-interacting factor 1 [Eublepharis macularius]
MLGSTLKGAQRAEGTGGPGIAAVPPPVAGYIYRIVQTTEMDGKKLLKLLPVSKTLGNAGPSIHSPVVSDNTKVNASIPGHIPLKTVFSNSTSSLVKIPSLLTAAPGTLILQKQLDKMELVKVTSVVNENPPATRASAIQNNYLSADKLSLQKDAASVSSVKSNILMNTNNLPVTVDSSVLPSGHHLQIPANAEVKSVPASCLPPSIQQKILAVAAANASVTSEAAKTPNVIYVSPVKTVKTPISKCLQNINPTSAAEISKPLALTTAQIAVNNSSSDAVTCNSQNLQEAPMKWVVQENPQSLKSCLVPVKSSNDMASRILKTFVDMKHLKSNPASVLPACSDSLSESQVKLTSVEDNALVMYNGKIYLLTRKRSSSGSAQDDKQTSAAADTPFRKHTSHVTNSTADSIISNQVVDLVLSKNKGVAINVKDSMLRENIKPPDLNKNLNVTPAFSTSPHGHLERSCTSQQGAMSASENIPVGIDIDNKTVTEENLNSNNSQKILSPKTFALQSSTNHGVSKKEEQKIEKINFSGMAVQIKDRKVQHRKQYTEIRKKFGLFKEERVYLSRIPLLNSAIKTEETECSSNVHMDDSCKFLQEVTVKTDPEEEEMIVGKQESNIKRNPKLPEPMIENAKRRKILGPSLARDDFSSVMDNRSSPWRQVISQQENPTSSLQFSSIGGSDPNPCVQSSEKSEALCPALCNINNEPSFSSGSLGEDSFLLSPPDLEEMIKDEKIERLKLLLRQQEEALEEMRKKMQI